MLNHKYYIELYAMLNLNPKQTIIVAAVISAAVAAVVSVVAPNIANRIQHEAAERKSQKRADIECCRSQIGAFESQLDAYQIHVGTYPTTEQGLQALLTCPTGLANPKKWRGTYTARSTGETPIDPWGNEYRYEYNGLYYIIWSYGPDGEGGTEDDIRSI